MQVLGIRTSPKTIRYAVIDFSGNSTTFLNPDGENKLDFPAAISKPEDKILWLYQELERIFVQYPDVGRIIIKEQEFGRGLQTRPDRDAAYLDGVVLLFAAQRRIEIDVKLYAAIGTNSKNVKVFSEEKVGRTRSSYDPRMADAIAAAWSGRDGST